MLDSARNRRPAAEWPESALSEAARRLTLSLEGRRLLRIGHCATVLLPAHGLVARIARPGTPSDRLEAEMRFARFVYRAGLPVLPPADEIADGAVATPTGPVTFWPLVASTGGAIDWRWVGDTLRRIHELSPAGGIDAVCDPLSMIATRIERYAAGSNAPAEVIRVFRTAYARVEKNWPAGNVALVHGDPANVIVTPTGPVLIDFDLSGRGPPLWDVVSVAVRQKRFGLSLAHIGEFYESYGRDSREDVGFDALLRVRELLDCSFALENAAHGELAVRLRALRDPSDRSAWTPVRR
jgi:hypothetical protein